jgi:hypothetical protein
MNEPHPEANPRTLSSGVVVIGSDVKPRAVGSQNIRGGERHVGRRGGTVLIGLIVVLGVALGAAWTLVARRELSSAIVADSAHRLDQAFTAFESYRGAVQDNLRSHCRVLVEDPRLKATLATPGMDVATVADILADIGKLRGTGFLMVLSPEGRVFAEAGAPTLRGVDLSASSVVKAAQSSSEAVVGSWVLDNRVMDLGITAVRYDDAIIAYLVVGAAIESDVLEAVADQTGVDVGAALAGNIVLSSSEEARTRAALIRIAGEPGAFGGRVMTIDGTSYVAGVVELTGTAQAQRLVLAREIDGASAPYVRLGWMLLVPPLLILIAMLFAMTGTRSLRRT